MFLIYTPHITTRIQYIFQYVFEERFGLEITNLPADFAIVFGSIKCVDRANAADTVFKIRPERLKAIANWRDNTHTGDDYSALGHDDIALSLKRGSVSCFPFRRFAPSGRVFLRS